MRKRFVKKSNVTVADDDEIERFEDELEKLYAIEHARFAVSAKNNRTLGKNPSKN